MGIAPKSRRGTSPCSLNRQLEQRNDARLVRYSDDFIILSKSRPAAEQVLAEARRGLCEPDLEPGGFHLVHGRRGLGIQR